MQNKQVTYKPAKSKATVISKYLCRVNMRCEQQTRVDTIIIQIRTMCNRLQWNVCRCFHKYLSLV